MVLEGGVAGAQPLHKGGRLRPTAQNCSGQWSVVSGWKRLGGEETLLARHDVGEG